MKNVLRFLGISAMILAVALLLLIPQASSNVLAADDDKKRMNQTTIQKSLNLRKL
ncbi:hypothetical protein P6439_14445 [Staphylococcus arlettae]|nr:hypothetical protein [Staphylococcus arlettae]MDN0189309.1 hypothetical protein [Staphylococcus arlettae]